MCFSDIHNLLLASDFDLPTNIAMLPCPPPPKTQTRVCSLLVRL